MIDTINAQINELMQHGISRKDISDGYHTFDELYYHRMILFSIICNQNKDRAWKSKLHEALREKCINGEMARYYTCGIRV